MSHYDNYNTNPGFPVRPRARSIGYAASPEFMRGHAQPVAHSYQDHAASPEFMRGHAQPVAHSYQDHASPLHRPHDFASPQTGFSPFPQGSPGVYRDRSPARTMDGYPQTPHQLYAHPNVSHPRFASQSNDDLALRDPFYPHVRPPSAGSHTPGSFYEPSMLPRQRRHSASVSFADRPVVFNPRSRQTTSLRVKFKRKGADHSGISLRRAQSPTLRLSGRDSYHYSDMHANREANIHLKLEWPGTRTLTYEIPLDCYDGRIKLESLARRVARAVVHFHQQMGLHISSERVQLQALEEVALGVWKPILTTK